VAADRNHVIAGLDGLYKIKLPNELGFLHQKLAEEVKNVQIVGL
jgi:hypothetical protein